MVTHSSLLKDFIYTASAINTSSGQNKTIDIVREHPVLKNISQKILFNTSYSAYPDALTPVDGKSIAEWSDGGSAIVIYSNITTGSMTEYLPFNINAIEKERNTLIANVIGWLLTNKSSPNIVIDSVAFPKAIVESQSTNYNITIKNTGSLAATTNITVLILNFRNS